MLEDQPLDSIPIWILYILSVLVILAAIEGGYRFSKILKRRSPEKIDVSLGGIAAASLALLAFLMAFVVSFGGTVNTERRHLVVDEANAIGTTYLRAGYLDEPYRTEARDLLREYTDQRLLSREQLEKAITRSQEIQNELWAGAEEIARANSTPTTSLYISALNEMIDLQSARIAVGLSIRIPPTIILGLYIVALFSAFLVGMQSGDSEKRNYFAYFILALTLSMVLFLIVDLDRTDEGFIKVTQQPFIDLQQQLNP